MSIPTSPAEPDNAKLRKAIETLHPPGSFVVRHDVLALIDRFERARAKPAEADPENWGAAKTADEEARKFQRETHAPIPSSRVVFDGPEANASLDEACAAMDAEIEAAGGLAAWRAAPEPLTDERAAFEKWAATLGLRLERMPSRFKGHGDYDWSETENRWKGWQARASQAKPAPDSFVLQLCHEHAHLGSFTWRATVASASRYRCPICEPQDDLAETQRFRHADESGEKREVGAALLSREVK